MAEDFSAEELFDSETGLMYSGDDMDDYRDLLGMYVDSKEKIFETLRTTLASQDFDAYRIQVHSLKSTSRMIGGMRCGAYAERCEHAARDKEVDFLKENTEPLLALFGQTVEEIKKFCEQGQ